MESTFTFNSEYILTDIRKSSHNELEAKIAEPSARYNIEAGSDKMSEIRECVIYADSQLRIILYKFLKHTSGSATISYTGNLPESLTYTMILSDRAGGSAKEQTLLGLIHSYLVDMSLAKFYSTTAPDLAKTRADNAAADAANILIAVNTKSAPIL